MNIKPIPPAGYLLQCLRYQDGALHWLERPLEHFKTKRAHAMWNARFSGTRAGRQMTGATPYRQVGLDGFRYLEHRLIAAIHGIDTSEVIDHKDGDSLNNDPANLRAATQAQNSTNRTGWKKKSSPCGVHQKANGRWVAYIRVGGKHTHLGTYANQQDALRARLLAERTYHGEFAGSLGANSKIHAFAAERGIQLEDEHEQAA